MARPKKDPKDKYETPARQLGRVSNEDWAELQAAAERAGLSFTKWALFHLLIAARKKK